MWRVYTSVTNMLHSRGYQSDTLMTRDAFYDRLTVHFTDTVSSIAETFDKGMFNCTMTHPVNEDTVLIVFMNEKTIGRKHVADLIERMSLSCVDHCVMVFPHTLTSSARKDLERHEFNVEAFSETELLYNVMNHVMMPKFTILSRREKHQLFGSKCLIKEQQLPRISISDKAARYLGLRRGEVVRIERESQTAGVTVSYRLCTL